jgi:ABC-2 type transport system ATP-binding protein
MSLIEVEHLRKTFRIAARKGGAFGTLRTLVSRDYRLVEAVDDISFKLERGEMVGYIGPNGAGKSTTIKMLTGILVPTSGHLVVDGRVPSEERVAHVRQIGVVFGQRTQLWWDLPTVESFELLRHVYRIPHDRWRANMDTFTHLLDLAPFSLGQRLRADLAAALLHEPSILFLDEPTIGLDVVAKERIRQFLTHVNSEDGITVILTTHDLQDIARLCQRVVLIDHGRIMYDGALHALRERWGRQRTLVVDLDEDVDEIEVPHAELVRREGPRAWLRFDRDQTTAAALIGAVSARYTVRDLTVEEPEIEAIVRHIYESGTTEVGSGQRD